MKVLTRERFRVRGYTLIVPPGRKGAASIPSFWDELIADGRRDALRAASSEPAWVLGLGSWDPACPKGGQRYTICIEETGYTDFSCLEATGPLYTADIGASDWLCFELEHGAYGRFWKDNPYRMMGLLGYRFHTGAEGDYSVGLHFDAYPPGFHPTENPAMEFWITVVKA